jgi:valyl-tRNA synthetase
MTGYPDGDDFKNYYPTSVMETGKDIIFFWVSRMVMLGLYRTGNVPFKKVYLHGMVRDKHGKKMSKSKGNVIAPSEIQEKYGTDALRMGLIVNNVPGTDMNLDPDKVNAYKKFANKLWNITRFVLDATHTIDTSYHPTRQDLSPTDQELLDSYEAIKMNMTRNMELEKSRYDLASEMIYHFVWNEFADKIIEESKGILEQGTERDKTNRKALLADGLVLSLKLLHPFMPFITETIWQQLPKGLKDSELLMVARWPVL